MIRCSNMICSAWFDGTFAQALAFAGWQPRGVFLFCPKCATNTVESPQAEIARLTATVAERDRRIADLERDNARLQDRLDSHIPVESNS